MLVDFWPPTSDFSCRLPATPRTIETPRSLALAFFAPARHHRLFAGGKDRDSSHDGSGTIERQNGDQQSVRRQMKLTQMTSGLGALSGDKPAAGAHPPSFNLMDEEAQKPQEDGREGVSFVSARSP